MLSAIRQSASSLLSKILIWSVALTFVGGAFFIWGKVKNSGGTVAIVYGEEISQDSYRQALNRIEEDMRARLKAEFDPSILDALNIKQVALETVIAASLQLKAAQEAGYVVTDEELTAAIGGMEGFKVDGVFNNKRYFETLKLNGLSPTEFEQAYRSELLVGKLRRAIDQSVILTDAENYSRYLYQNQDVKVSYVKIDTKSLAEDIHLTDQGLTTFYESTKNDFLTPEERQFSLVSAPLDAFASDVEPTETEINRYYDVNAIEFEIPEAVEVSQILIKLPPGADDEQKGAGKLKIDAIHKRLTAGEDFVALAKELSEGPSADNGGNLGSFGRGSMVAEFDEVAFSLEPGAISEPFITPFGWHIITTRSHTETHTAPLDEVRSKIVKTLIARRTRETAYDFMSALSAKATTDNINSLVNSDDRVRSISTIALKGIKPSEQIFPEEVEDDIFLVEPGTGSDPRQTSSGYSFVLVNKVIDPFSPPLDEVRQQVGEAYRKRLANELSEKTADRIVEALAGGASIEDAATAEHLSVVAAPPYSRNSLGMIKHPVEGAFQEVFALKQGDSTIVNSGGNKYVIMHTGWMEIDKEMAGTEIAMGRKEALEKRRAAIYAEFIAGLREKAWDEGQIQILIEQGKPAGTS